MTLLETIIQQENNKHTTAMLSALMQGDACKLSDTLPRAQYEQAYIKAWALLVSNHIVKNNQIVKHIPVWNRRIR